VRGLELSKGINPSPDAPQRVEDARERTFGASTSPYGRGEAALAARVAYWKISLNFFLMRADSFWM
jgi:hypothetical protein